MCGLNETTPVSGESEMMDSLGVRSERAEAVWWLGQLLCAVTDKVDEVTLRVTVVPAARHILEGLQ